MHQYAQRIISTPGKQDGLAWKKPDGTWDGPVGEAVAHAIEQGYSSRSEPYHGYYFKVLKGQGPAAPLGQLDYVVKGAMIGGFALAAAPAEYGVTGVKTFIVSQDGVVYQKDLGAKTLEAFKIDGALQPRQDVEPRSGGIAFVKPPAQFATILGFFLPGSSHHDRAIRHRKKPPTAPTSTFVPAHGQSPRPDHRRHGNRQDRQPSGAGRSLLAARRAGVSRRRQRRSLRRGRGRLAVAEAQGAARLHGHRRAGLERQPVVFWDVVRPPRLSRARDDFRRRTAAARPALQPERRRSRACCRWCSRSPTTTACCCST